MQLHFFHLFYSLVDSDSGTFRDPTTGEVMSLAAAITFGFLKAPHNKGSGAQYNEDAITFEEAMRKGLIDVKNNTFLEPITEVLMPLDAAIRNGFIILPEGGISVEVSTLCFRDASKGTER